MDKKWQYRVIISLLILIVIYLLYILKSVAIPILLSTIIAYLLDPLVDRLEKFRIGRGASILILTLSVVAFFVLVILLVIPAIEQEIMSLAQNMPEYMARIKGEAGPFFDKSFRSLFPAYDFSTTGLLMEGESLLKKIPADLLKNILSAVTSTFKGTLSLILSVLGILIMPLYIYYILKDFDTFKDGIISLLPFRSRPFIIKQFKEVDETLSSFIRGQIIICVILAAIYSVGLYLIGIDLALVIGILSGAAFIIPYIGTVLGIIAASFLAFVEFHDITHIIYVLILYGGTQLLEGFFITPRVIGNKVGLHPLAILLSIIIGGELFGFLGILLAVPAAAILKIFTFSAIESYKNSLYYHGSEQ